MSDALSLPVLPLDETVVLPTMVVTVDTSGTEARAAIEAAQISAGADGASKATPQVLLVPRVDGKYSSVGTLGAVEQIGRLPSGEPAAAIRGLSRVRIGSGTVGPGAALWVEGSVEEEPPEANPGAGTEAARSAQGPHCGSRAPSSRSRRRVPAPTSSRASTVGWPPRSCRSAGRGRSSTCCSGSPTRRPSPTAPGTRPT